MNEPTLHPTEEQISAFIDGHQQNQPEVREHIDNCPECTALVFSIISDKSQSVAASERPEPTRVDQLRLMRNALDNARKITNNESKNANADASSKPAKSQWGILGAMGGLIAGNATDATSPALGNPALGNNARGNNDQPPSDSDSDSSSDVPPDNDQPESEHDETTNLDETVIQDSFGSMGDADGSVAGDDPNAGNDDAFTPLDFNDQLFSTDHEDAFDADLDPGDDPDAIDDLI